jgi:tRNA uridine 5-carboxymethylaminomethyl modification enzyme
MFTSRAEYRLSLREDNADLRLTARGRELGLVDDARWEFFVRKRAAVEAEIGRLSNVLVRPEEVNAALLAKLKQPLQREVRAFELLRRPELGYDDLPAEVASGDGGPAGGDWRGDERMAEQVRQQVDVQAKYAGYLKRQDQDIDRQQRHEDMRLPDGIDYSRVGGLSTEARQSLEAVRPETLGQAARIPGLTPAALSLLLVYLKKHDRAA